MRQKLPSPRQGLRQPFGLFFRTEGAVVFLAQGEVLRVLRAIPLPWDHLRGATRSSLPAPDSAILPLSRRWGCGDRGAFATREIPLSLYRCRFANMKPLVHLLIIVTVACVLVFAGCKATRKDTAEMDTLLQTVSYDTTVPATPTSAPAPALPQSTSASSGASLTEKAGAFRQSIGDGLRTAAGFLLLGVFKVFESALGLDDDDDSTPRGRADRNFNQWLDDRAQWRRDG